MLLLIPIFISYTLIFIYFPIHASTVICLYIVFHILFHITYSIMPLLCLSFVYMCSFMCFVIFYLSLSFLSFMYFYHVFLACSIIFLSICLSYIHIILSYIHMCLSFMYFRLSHFMTYPIISYHILSYNPIFISYSCFLGHIYTYCIFYIFLVSWLLHIALHIRIKYDVYEITPHSYILIPL